MLKTISKAWFYGRGLDLLEVPVKMEHDLTLAKKACKLADQWNTARTMKDISKLSFTESDLLDVSSMQIVHCHLLNHPVLQLTYTWLIVAFLEHLKTFPPLPSPMADHLGTVYKFSTSSQAEIRFQCYQVASLTLHQLLLKPLWSRLVFKGSVQSGFLPPKCATMQGIQCQKLNLHEESFCQNCPPWWS